MKVTINVDDLPSEILKEDVEVDSIQVECEEDVEDIIKQMTPGELDFIGELDNDSLESILNCIDEDLIVSQFEDRDLHSGLSPMHRELMMDEFIDDYNDDDLKCELESRGFIVTKSRKSLYSILEEGWMRIKSMYEELLDDERKPKKDSPEFKLMMYEIEKEWNDIVYQIEE